VVYIPLAYDLNDFSMEYEGPDYRSIYLEEADAIRRAVSSMRRRLIVHHYGSTAIKIGNTIIPHKPILDLLLEIAVAEGEDIPTVLDSILPVLLNIGYVQDNGGALTTSGIRFITAHKPSNVVRDRVKINLQVTYCTESEGEIVHRGAVVNSLNFRDYLNENPHAALLYAASKTAAGILANRVLELDRREDGVLTARLVYNGVKAPVIARIQEAIKKGESLNREQAYEISRTYGMTQYLDDLYGEYMDAQPIQL
jgi:GrpB-like predicted nucleotidyltransferase (UPF0157 family)